MSTKLTVVIALVAGFIGGTISHIVEPTPVRAQEQVPIPQEIRAHKFVLVDDSGVDRGVFGFALTKKGDSYPTIELMDTKGGTQIIKAQAPMSEMLNYQNDLTSMTQGRASFSMEFDHYDYVPGMQAEKIIAAAKAAKTGEEEEEE